MRTIEIVTHCWAERDWRYAAALNYQLASLLHHKPKICDVFVSVYFHTDDDRVRKVLELFEEFDKLNIFWKEVDSLEYLGRRSIGRNHAAKTTKADLVWFADADYYFGEGALDYVADISWLSGTDSLLYPRTVWICKTHEIGDGFLGLVKQPTLDVPKFVLNQFTPPVNFVKEKYTRAIGGAQIVEGDFARNCGYLDGVNKWQTPCNPHKPFGNKGRGTHTPDDVAFRHFCNQYGFIKGVEIPNVFRIRHTEGLKDDTENQAVVKKLVAEE